MNIKLIPTERLIVRKYEISDAPLLKEAIDSSIDHLAEFLDWIQFEPETLEEKELRLVQFRAEFENNEQRYYGLFSKDNTVQIGAVGLHIHPYTGKGGVEIGCWIRESHNGKGYATEATQAVIPVAFDQLGFEYIEIHTRLDNTKSETIPQKLGFTFDRIRDNMNVRVLKKQNG